MFSRQGNTPGSLGRNHTGLESALALFELIGMAEIEASLGTKLKAQQPGGDGALCRAVGSRAELRLEHLGYSCIWGLI